MNRYLLVKSIKFNSILQTQNKLLLNNNYRSLLQNGYSLRNYCNNNNHQHNHFHNNTLSNTSSLLKTNNNNIVEENDNEENSKSLAERFEESMLPEDAYRMPRLNMRSPKVDKYVHEAYDEAHRAFDAGDYETALKKYFWIINKLPYDTTAYLQRSLVYEALGKFEEAIQDCERVIRMSNQSDAIAEAHMIKGVNLMRNQKFSEAVTAFELSLGLVENDVVHGLKKKAQSMINPDMIIVPRYEDDYQFYEFLSRELEGNVQIKLSNTHGRGLFATRDIGPEELIFETRSIVSTSSSQVKDDNDHCHNCHISFKPIQIENEAEISKSREFDRLAQTITRMTRLPVGRIEPEGCTQCNTTLFCSPECMQDGIEKHNSLCENNTLTKQQMEKFEKELSGLTQTEKIGYMMLLKLIASQSVNGDQNNPIRKLELDDYVKRLSYAMPSNANISGGEDIQLSKKDQKILKVLKEIFHTRKLNSEIFYRLKSIVTLNQIHMFTSKIKVHCTPAPMDELGYNFEFEDKPSKYIAGLPLHLSFVNHSCDPNVFIASPIINDKQIRIVTSKPIKKGEEIFISYIDGLGLTTHKRQEMLGESYGFQCSCPHCRANTTLQVLAKIQ